MYLIHVPYSVRVASLAVVVAIIVGLVADRYKAEKDERSRNFGPDILPSYPASYTSSYNPALERITLYSPSSQSPDTTAIILNWSRFHNVVRIVSVLCAHSLQNTIATVLVWNNSPRKLSQKDFEGAHCTKGKLVIQNSPENLYFHARYLACAQATTTHCFFQDDDYLIWPEIINTLQYQISRSLHPRIHLLPPHEVLSSQFRTIRTGSNIHASFAWLGHGTIIKRSEAVRFLALMNHLNVSIEELRMADNYFTILSNTFSEVWFDQGVELGGGEPFTVGPEGDERNRRHIIRATQLLEAVIGQIPPPDGTTLSYTRRGNEEDGLPMARAPCRGSICLFETTIKLVPDEVEHFVPTAGQMLILEGTIMRLMGTERRTYYRNHPPSHAVDGRPDTAFRSPQDAEKGDVISINTMKDLASWGQVELVFLVDDSTEAILKASAFEVSFEESWALSPHILQCIDSSIISLADKESGFLRECSVQMLPVTNMQDGPRRFQARLERSVAKRWCIYEAWLRGIESQQL